MSGMAGLAALLVALCATTVAQAAPSVTFVPVADRIHDSTLRDAGDGSFEIVTTGSDPYVFLQRTGGVWDPSMTVLAMEYASPQGTDALQVYVFAPLSEENSVTQKGLALSEGWSTHSIDLASVFRRMNGKWDGLRLDLGNQPGRIVRIRAIELRQPNARELEMAAREDARRTELQARDKRMEAYLKRRFACRVTSVRVGTRAITIAGDASRATGQVCLAEVPIWMDVTALGASPTLKPITKSGPFRVTLPRFDRQRDRLTSRWAVVRKTGRQLVLLSAGHYPDEVTATRKMVEQKPRTQKGLGGFWIHDSLTSDLDELGISAVTVNMWLNNMFSTQPGPGWSPFKYGGRTYYSNDGAINGYDHILAEPARRGIVVSAIILVGHGATAPAGSWSRLVAHPDAHPSGIYVMPNMDDPEGVQAYAAALDFLARRYMRPDNRYGRIHHWILHNEINAGWIWTNAGEKTDTLYMDLYNRSMRLAHLIGRQYDAHSKAFISLEHHWNMTPEPRFYTGRRLLELLLRYGAVEGDFDWALAFHPYPDSLLQPRTWEDKNATFALDTPKITFHNIEVLDAWSKQRSTWYRGRTPRTIHCTEQGLNSPDYSEKSLREQAAGMAYTWKKLSRLKSIEAFQYHAWIDNRGEFGLRIGLRKFPDEPGDPYGKKPIWEVYRAMGTPDEDRVLDQYKTVVGVKDWDEVCYKGPIR